MMFSRRNNLFAKRRDRQKGVAVVEFTIVLPILLVLILVVAELGRAFLQFNALTRAVRDSAKYVSANAINGTTGVVDVSATAPVYSEAQHLVVFGHVGNSGTPLLPGLVPGNVTIANPGGTTDITVNVSYTYQPMLGAVLPGLFYGTDLATNYPLQAQVTMKAL